MIIFALYCAAERHVQTVFKLNGGASSTHAVFIIPYEDIPNG